MSTLSFRYSYTMCYHMSRLYHYCLYVRRILHWDLILPKCYSFADYKKLINNHWLHHSIFCVPCSDYKSKISYYIISKTLEEDNVSFYSFCLSILYFSTYFFYNYIFGLLASSCRAWSGPIELLKWWSKAIPLNPANSVKPRLIVSRIPKLAVFRLLVLKLSLSTYIKVRYSIRNIM